jgi:hypothetical protein
MTFRRGPVERPAQVTAALRATIDKKGSFGPRDVIGLSQPKSLAPRGARVREKHFGTECGVKSNGRQQGPVLSISGEGSAQKVVLE